jgi:hypothetical protein
MIKLNLAYRNLARLSDLSRRVGRVFPQQRQTRFARQRAQRLGSFMSDHRAVCALFIHQDSFQSGDGAGIFDLAEDVGEFVL